MPLVIPEVSDQDQQQWMALAEEQDKKNKAQEKGNSADQGDKDKTNDSNSSSKNSDPAEKWTNELRNKTVTNEATSKNNYTISDLPKPSRVIKQGDMVTRDFNPERLNVHLDHTGVVSHCTFG